MNTEKQIDACGPAEVSGVAEVNGAAIHSKNQTDGSDPVAVSGVAQDYGAARGSEVELDAIIDELMKSSSDSSDSSDDDDDEDLLELIADESSSEELDCLLLAYQVLERKKRNSIKNYLEDVVPTYTEAEFKQHFRISKELFKKLSERVNDAEWYQNLRADKRLHATTYMAVFLWFAGHEACSFRDLSDRFNLCLATISRIIKRVTMFISSFSPEVIKWPTEDKKRESALFFKNKSGFSKAIGCIDGTHIVIDPPKSRKDDYMDRKCNISLCMQGVCDENKKFINIFVGYPGSSHDSWVFNNSRLGQTMASACGDYYLLGDSAYGCTQYLITPYKDNGQLTREQINFNIKLSSARVTIEHTFGILKQRFRQLYYCKLRGNIKLCHFIRSCCVLHNLANEDDFNFEITESIDDYIASNYNNQYGETAKGNAVRNAICSELKNSRV